MREKIMTLAELYSSSRLWIDITRGDDFELVSNYGVAGQTGGRNRPKSFRSNTDARVRE